MKTKVVNITKIGQEYDVYIGRPSIFGNPFVIDKDGTREEVVSKFKDYFYDRIEWDLVFRAAVEELRGKVLACYCAPLLCHGNVIAEFLNRREVK